MKKSIKICERDNYTCQICGKRISNYTYEGQLDHLIPKSLGGSSSIDNLHLTCAYCNNKRKNRANKLLLNSIIEKLDNSLDAFDIKLLKYELKKGGISKKDYEIFIEKFQKTLIDIETTLYAIDEVGD